MTISINCPHCDSTLTLKDDRSVGKNVACPRCAERFVIELPSDDDLDDVEEFLEDSDEKDWEEPTERTSRQGREPRRRPPKPSRSNTGLIIGGVIAGLLFFVMGIVVIFVIQKDNKNKQPVAQQNPSQFNRPNNNDVRQPRATVDDTPLTDAELRELGTSIVAAFNAKQPHLVSSHFDWPRLLDKALAGVEVPQQFRAGFLSRVGSSDGMLGTICNRITDQGARLMRIRDNSGQKRIQFRFNFADASVNYAEFVPIRLSNGSIRIVDAYFYSSGELITVTFRRSMLPIIAKSQPSLIDRLTGRDRDHIQNLTKREQLTRSLAARQGKQALQLYHELPKSMREDKALMLARIQAAQIVGETEYLAAMEEFRRLFANDTALEMILLDYYILKKDYSAALKCAENAEKAIGGDAHMHSIASNMHLLLGNTKKARQVVREAIQMEPTLLGPQTTLLDVLIAEKDYDATLAQLKLLRNDFLMEFRLLTQVPECAEFVKSSQFKEYIEFLDATANE